MLPVETCDRDEFVENLTLARTIGRAIQRADSFNQFPSRRHAHLPHRSLPANAGSSLDEATAALPGAFQARQCAGANHLTLDTVPAWAGLVTKVQLDIRSAKLGQQLC